MSEVSKILKADLKKLQQADEASTSAIQAEVYVNEAIKEVKICLYYSEMNDADNPD